VNGIWISECEVRTIDKKVGSETVMCEVLVQTEAKSVTER